MTYIILKLEKGGVPIKWKKVCVRKRLLPSNEWLNDEYDIKDEDIISVRHTKRSESKFKWKGYRTAFKHIYNGTLKGFKKYCTDWYKKNVWGKKSEVGAAVPDTQQ